MTDSLISIGIFLAAIISGVELTKYFEAASVPESCHAMQQEVNGLAKNGTWTMTILLPGKCALGCK